MGNMDREYKIGHYPFTKEEPETRIHLEFGRHLSTLLREPLFDYQDRGKMWDLWSEHFTLARSYFEKEEQARINGDPNANLFYHNKEHAVHQAGYDAATISIMNLRRNQIAPFLTPEGISSIIIAAEHHDDGYVYQAPDGANYAARRPIHVNESIRAALDSIDEIGVPPSLSKTRIKELVQVGIHATNFPFSEDNKQERRQLVDGMDTKDKKEAVIVALSVQLADLGGQVARPDYKKRLLDDLRRELNCEEEGKGDEMIGVGEEMSAKCNYFMENFVQTTVGKTARALYGVDNNTFVLEWEKVTRD